MTDYNIGAIRVRIGSALAELSESETALLAAQTRMARAIGFVDDALGGSAENPAAVSGHNHLTNGRDEIDSALASLRAARRQYETYLKVF